MCSDFFIIIKNGQFAVFSTFIAFYRGNGVAVFEGSPVWNNNAFIQPFFTLVAGPRSAVGRAPDS